MAIQLDKQTNEEKKHSHASIVLLMVIERKREMNEWMDGKDKEAQM